MKILSCNVNGIRAACKKGFLEWFFKTKADIVCLQEVKAQKEQMPIELGGLFSSYQSYFNFAVKRGYSGLAVYTKQKPVRVFNKLGIDRFDQEGRMLGLEYPEFTLINFYIPHGGRQKENLEYKLEAYKRILGHLNKSRNKNFILAGDFNIAHQEIDLARPKGNKDNIMFTPKEREQIDNILSLGFVDSFREKNKEAGNYTWWPYAFEARERNVGWRIDYVFVSKSIASKLKNAFILREVDISDHCPIGLEI